MDRGFTRDEGRLVLDRCQEAALSQGRGPVVVLGEAGSGKTTVVVERAAFLLQSGSPPDDILVLALSRASADELSTRLAARAGRHVPAVSTVHGFAYGLVRRHYRLAGYARQPRWFRTREAWQHLRRTLEGRDTHQPERPHGPAGSRTMLALVNDLIAGMANNDLDTVEAERALRTSGRADLAKWASFALDYQALLKRECLLDAEMAVLEALRLLRRHPQLTVDLHEQYPHVLVDEFEQATFAQSRLIRLLSSTGLFVAGNPDQATNSFRGGSPGYLRELSRLSETHLVHLTEVHRSSPEVRAASRQVLSVSSGAIRERDGAWEEGVAARSFEHQRDEVYWLAAKIEAMVQAGTPANEIAVLFRRGSDPVARELANRLLAAGIPVSAMRTAVSVASDPMVASSVDVLRLVTSPPDERNALFLKLLASPLGGLTPSEVRWIRRLAAEQRCSALVLATSPALLEGLPARLAELAADLASRVHQLEADGRGRSYELLWQIWTSFPALASQAAFWGQGRLGETAGCPAAFRCFLEEVFQVVEDTPSATAVDIIRLFDGGHFEEMTVSPPAGNRKGVHIGTIHEARGLEWECVIIPNLVEDLYPLRRSPIGSLAPILLREDGEPRLVRDRHLAEERRVLGVALSRAKSRLVVTYSRVAFDGTTRLVPSRYLDRIGTALPGLDSAADCAATAEDIAASGRRRLWTLDAAHASSEGTLEERLLAAEALYTLGRLAEMQPNKVEPKRWWDLIEPTEGALAPYPDGVLYLSASRLAAYRDCPLKFKFSHHLSLDDVSNDAMTLGTLLHAVLEEYHRPGACYPRGRHTLEQLLDRFFDPAKFSRPAIARQSRRKAGELLDKYFPLYGWQSAALAVEQPLGFRLGTNNFSGRIDRIDRLADGSLELIDYKSGGPMTQEEARDDIQLALYELAFQVDPELARLGMPSIVTYLYPKAISEKLAAKLAESGGPPRKSPRGRGDGTRSYIPTNEGRERLISRINRYSEGIRAEKFPSKSNILQTWPDLDPEEARKSKKPDPCRVCGFKWLCEEMERGTADA